MTPTIQIDDLTKRFGKTVALDHLTMAVPAGQVHGFLGPNGAGKSTAIRVLLGLLRPTSGRALLFGRDPWADAAALHRHLAYVPGDVNLWPNLTGGECIDVIGRARGGLDPARRAELIDAFELDPRKRARTYSKGNRQKVALVAALASDVDLLILDEPTSGLDPLMERVFTERIRAEHRAGRTVLLSSHILSEVEALCDHVSIIKDGRLVQTGPLDELRHLHRVRVAAELDHEVPSGLDRLPGVSHVSADGRRLTCDVTDDGLSALLAELASIGVRTLTSTPPTLEELFMSSYETTPRRAAAGVEDRA